LQRVGIYFAVLFTTTAFAILIHSRFNLGLDRSTLIAAGMLFLITATGQPWWLFDTVRRVRWFGMIESDRAMQWVLVLLAVFLIILGLAVTSSSEY
jgi:hypothetical protein